MEERSTPKQILAVEQLLANIDPVTDDPRRAAALLEECPPRLRGWEWGLPEKAAPAPKSCTISGHSAFVCGIDFRPGTNDVSLSVGSSRGLDLGSGGGSPIRRIHGPDGTAFGASIDRSGTRLATAGSDGQVKVWNVVLGRSIMPFAAIEGWVADVAFSPDGTRLASAGQDDKVRIWNLAARARRPVQRTRVPTGHLRRSGGIFGVAWSADGKRLATAGKDGTVRVWDLSQSPPGTPLILRGHEGEVLCVSFHPGGSLIASGGADRMRADLGRRDRQQRRQFPRGRQSRECHRLQPGWQVAWRREAWTARSAIWDAATWKPAGKSCAATPNRSSKWRSTAMEPS